MKTDCLSSDYIRRTDQPQFDDRELKDEWQLPVYLFARGVQTHCGAHTVIDVGCGSAYKLRSCFWDINKIGIEENPETLSFIRANRDFNSKHDVYVSPDEFYGLISTPELVELNKMHHEECICVCSDVIEHVDDPVEFFRYLLTIPWKNMVISTPVRHPHEWQGPPGNIHHSREWAFDEFYGFLLQWNDEIDIKLHCLINPEQRTQMAWLVRKESGADQETESPSGETGDSTQDSSSSSLDSPSDIADHDQM